jgi:hypothetical protein
MHENGGFEMKTKKVLLLVAILIAVLFLTSTVLAAGGYDIWGYNYTANMFNGLYCDAYRDADWCQEYKDISLMMKWNDAWMDENKDRHVGFDSYIGSGAWLTNHQKGEYELEGQVCKWEYFVKIMAANETDFVDGGSYYNADGVLLGQAIWGSFYIGQQVSNDTCAGEHGILSLTDPGVGN